MRVFGLDGGMASIGWAVAEEDDEALTLIAAGTWMFDAPETDKDHTAKNAIRRQHRGQRRVIRRRRQRMAAIRRLFHTHGLVPAATRDVLLQPGLDPWTLRADALDRPLQPVELAIALGHIARHRGFRSNAKREASSNAPDETSVMLKAIEGNRERLGQWPTAGVMFARDPAFADRKRNRDGSFDRSILRRDHEDEVRTIFAAQRRMGSALATPALEAAFADLAFSQRPLQDSEHLIGTCPFEPDQMRTARRGYAFEMFRLLSRLNTLTLVTGVTEARLTPDQIARVTQDFGRQKRISYTTLRRVLGLDKRTRFAGIDEKDEKLDVVARTGDAAAGTHVLRDVVGDGAWRDLMAHPERRDRIAEVISFRSDLGSIRRGLEEAGVEPILTDALVDAAAAGRFSDFTGAGHISAKAARAIIPGLARGLVYSDACAAAGYDHAAQKPVSMDDIRNPVARKALSEMCKQVRALIRAHGVPDAIHVELARDIGKGKKERDEITRGIERRNKERDRLRAEFRELLQRDASMDELLRFELWKEQNGRCLYSDAAIDPSWLIDGSNRVQVDHILPYSRSADDSFRNKTLCLSTANQPKRNRTPFEWFTADGLDWAAFSARVEGCRAMHPSKRRNFYLRRNFQEVEERFISRNINDMRYACRALLGWLKQHYPTVDVQARPGPLTAKLRRAWGLEDLKKGPDGKRLSDDRHHALDAIVVAATSRSAVQKLTRAAQEAERRGDPRGFDFALIPPPTAGFREVVREVVGDVFVARAERRRARGEGHAATIKQVREIDGEPVVFERKAVEKLTEKDLDLIPMPEPYGKVRDPARLRDEMVAALRRWIAAGKPKDDPPKSHAGHVIRKVRVRSTDKVAVTVRGGTADRGEMARVDVFARPDRREYFMVPVYPHQVANRQAWPQPPDRAVTRGKDESEWDRIDGTYEFLFSLGQNSLIEITKNDGEVLRGYFKGLDRNTGAISVAPHHDPQSLRRGIGTRRLPSLVKLSVNRLGTVSGPVREIRTWHGVACT